VRILQAIASGLLGPDAFTGGWSIAALGLALHFLIEMDGPRSRRLDIRVFGE